ncbi:MAG: peptidase C11 [Lachnospiraceae bacterium]|nr:peptidase C11 [Lachnospiraceae bacterium]
MADNMPRRRQKRVTGGSANVHKRGEGLGTGKVGSGSGLPHTSQTPLGTGSQGPKRSGGGSPLLYIIIAAVVLLGGGGGLSTLLGGGGSSTTTTTAPQAVTQPYDNSSASTGAGTSVQTPSVTSQGTAGSSTSSAASASSSAQPASSQAGLGSFGSGTLGDLSSLFGGFGASSLTQSSTGWTEGTNNTGNLNRSVAPEAREKFTKILGNGKDKVTIMVYMCGTDLESKNGMATADLKEMATANRNDNVNILVYTGGCRAWKIQGISNTYNQIYRVAQGGLQPLVQNDGNGAMTDPNTLLKFIKWASDNYPANRYHLIFWDHGGGSISGYGYDEKQPRSGSMNLAQINSALKASGLKYDVIGFDACLMATTETALMLSQYADYMIASEEIEPGTGWYYTNWLTELAANPSLPTLDIGKRIIDDFVDVCAKTTRGQSTTLSLVDLSELGQTVPASLAEFAQDTSEQIENKEYKNVADARTSSREFAAATRIDQVDLVDLANKIGSEDSKALASSLLSAIKYNRTSANMTNSYGLSIYFPYKKLSSVDTMVSTYKAIGLDDSYAKCIQQFATVEAGSQSVSSPLGAGGNPFPMLSGSGSYSSSSASSDMIGQLIGSLLSGSLGGVSGLDASNSGFLSARTLDEETLEYYLTNDQIDPSALFFSTDEEGRHLMLLSDQQRQLIKQLDLNMYYDDGEGYIDLGLDNTYEFTEEGALIGDTDRTWLSVDGSVVAYYHTGTVDDGENYTITGYIPAFLNGDRVELIVVFDNENPYGYIAGARYDYHDGETETAAKSMTELAEGDKIDFICDYYSYSGEYQDSYYLGEQYTYTGQPEISNIDLGSGKVLVMYRITDIYGQTWYTPAIEQ